MSTPPPPGRRSAGDRKTPPSSSIITRNGARKAKIQTRAMSAGAKPSAVVVAAKKKAQMKKKHQGSDILVRDHLHIAMQSKHKVKGPTGFVTEPRMADHLCLWDKNYPEGPHRLTSVIERCEELELISHCKCYPARAATKEELNVLHSPSVYEMLEKTHGNQDLEYLEEVSSRYDAVYIHPSTHELALIAAGSTIDMVDRIVAGDVQNGFAAVRPPGHHAMRAEPCGYCFYNNVALAAKHAIEKHGLKRILIVDWDVHHGQATQQMFYDDPRVVYFSIHRYEHGAFWPNLKQSDFHYTGAGKGEGYTFNVPLNATGMKDADYLAIWHQLLIPMALEYRPELILISAGYDAAVGCPEVLSNILLVVLASMCLLQFSPQLVIVSAGYDSAIGDEKGEMLLSPACYATLVHQLMCVNASLCVVLEGGYCARSLAESAALTLRTLLGHPPPRIDSVGEPCDSVRESILNCIYTHRKTWKCFNFQPVYNVDTSVPYVCGEDEDKHYVFLEWKGDESVPERYQTRDCYPVQSEKAISDAMAILDQMNSDTDLSIAKHPVCYIYDEKMLKHKNIFEPGHVECPERIQRIHELHNDYGLLKRVEQITSRAATDQEILTVHTENHLANLTKLADKKVRDLLDQKKAYDSVYFHPDSLESATTAAGCVLQMVDAVTTGYAGSGVCVVRPPGHHADKNTPSGFCLLNNVAIGARYALDVRGVQRVLILDWDVHHGNGTQRLTYDSDKILYMSIHRYDNGSFFPNSKDANYTAVGEGAGEGFNVNIPWNKRGLGDAEYLAAMTQVVLPIAYEFRPQLVLVSAGFDAAVGDPLGGCNVSPECFAQMTMMLRGLASGRVILCLEGGYNVETISYCMTLCTKALLGDPLPPTDTCSTYHPSAIESINNVISVQKKYWKSLKFQLALPIQDVIEKPGPSRGLVVTEDAARGYEDLAELSISSENGATKDSKNSDQSEVSLEQGMADLNIGEPSCSGGLHCDSNDEIRDDTEEGPIKESTSEQDGLNASGSNSERTGSDSSDDSGRAGPSTDDAGPSTERVERNPGAAGPGGNLDEAGPSSGRIIIPDGVQACRNGAAIFGFDMDGAPTLASDEQSTQPVNPEKLSANIRRFLTWNIMNILREEGGVYAVVPQSWCPHIDELPELPACVRFVQGTRCVDCNLLRESWACLHCYNVYCSRYLNKHLQLHFASTKHPLALSLTDLSVWCSACNVYLDNPRLYAARNNAHRCKFGVEMPRRQSQGEE